MLHPSEMSPADLWSLRALHFGLSTAELLLILGTDARAQPASADEPALAKSVRRQGKPLSRKTISRWESGEYPLSAPNAEALQRLIRYTQDVEDALAAAHAPGAVIGTYRTDDALHAARPDLWPSLPAAWYQAVAWRAAERIGGSTAYGPLPPGSA